MSDKNALVLETFLPYRLATLSTRISNEFAKYYSKRYQLSMQEWRVIAVLGISPGVSAGYICDVGELDKVAVSRAVSKLLESGRIVREFAKTDKRRSILHLSEEGQQIYNDIVPEAKNYEAAILTALNDEERQTLDRILTKLANSELSLKG